MTENEISKHVVDIAYCIHSELGAGLLESVYEEIMFYELIIQGLKVERQKIMPVHYKQLLTYLKITEMKLGLLINFNESLIKDGITRIVNNL